MPVYDYEKQEFRFGDATIGLTKLTSDKKVDKKVFNSIGLVSPSAVGVVIK